MGAPDIRRWVIKVCKKYKLSSFYLPYRDTWMIHFKGRALTGFDTTAFYQIPKDAREQTLMGILKRGLMLNIDERQRDNLYTKRHLGQVVWDSK